MIKSIIFTGLCCLAVIAGGVGADFMQNQPSEPAEAGSVHATSKSKTEHKKPDGHKKSKAKSSSGHGKKGGHKSKVSDTVYLKFQRQFVVPVMSGGDVDSLVMLNLQVELGDDAPSEYLRYEPKFRDAFMRDLLGLSNAGHFDASLTSAGTYDLLQKTLIHSARGVMNTGVINVLILDIAKQDQ